MVADDADADGAFFFDAEVALGEQFGFAGFGAPAVVCGEEAAFYFDGHFQTAFQNGLNITR